jgi:hypothetical protein
MAKITAGQPMDLVAMSQAEAKVGDYKYSALNEAAFSGEHLGTWMLCDGRSCVGTNYQTLTGSATVPNAVSEGLFIRAKSSARAVASTEGDAIRNIVGPTGVHAVGAANQNPSGPCYFGSGYTNSFSGVSGNNQSSGWIFDASRVVPTAPENRPKNIALNLYVKVGY